MSVVSPWFIAAFDPELRRSAQWKRIRTRRIDRLYHSNRRIGQHFFHTIAVRWSEWSDVAPILVFMLLNLWLVARRFLG